MLRTNYHHSWWEPRSDVEITTCGHALVESSWNVMVHDDTRDGKWMGKLVNGMGSQHRSSVASTLHTTSEHGVSRLLLLMRTPPLTVGYWTDTPADFKRLIRFAERRNLVSARAPSYFIRSLLSLSQNAVGVAARNIHYVHKEVILEDGSVISSAPHTHEHKHVMSQWISAVGVAPVYCCNFLNELAEGIYIFCLNIYSARK
jgi:hypothetical protein